MSHFLPPISSPAACLLPIEVCTKVPRRYNLQRFQSFVFIPYSLRLFLCYISWLLSYFSELAIRRILVEFVYVFIATRLGCCEVATHTLPAGAVRNQLSSAHSSRKALWFLPSCPPYTLPPQHFSRLSNLIRLKSAPPGLNGVGGDVVRGG